MEDGGGSVGTRASRPGGSIPPRFLFTRSIHCSCNLKVHSPLALITVVDSGL